MTTSTEPVPVARSSEEIRAARHKRMRRFNALVVYLPLAVAALIAIGVLVWLAVRVITGAPDASRDTASGLSSIVLLSAVLFPALLSCGVLPALGLFALGWRAQNGSIVQKRMTGLFGRIDGLLDTVQHRVDDTTPKIAAPMIQLKGRGRFVGRLLQSTIRGTEKEHDSTTNSL